MALNFVPGGIILSKQYREYCEIKITPPGAKVEAKNRMLRYDWYIPIGATCARLKYSIQIFDQDQYVLRGETREQKVIWGFATGIGFERKIADNYSLFAEYDAYLFDSNKITKNISSSVPPAEGDYMFRSKQVINAIRAGVKVLFG